ncbi:hypothetical protein DPMN_068854 [Dreissena polymorpha]|uniref:Uncharacterized protein n=1 Tax=Dreissena polymorpha TaxID=45954 RepID=A0A9D3Z308_DREPO|nr:hypothetical protein DPMN_068854 [Dreissena polymorpha]
MNAKELDYYETWELIHEDWTKKVTSRTTNVTYRVSQVFQPTGTIFEHVNDRRRTMDKKRSQKLTMRMLCSGDVTHGLTPSLLSKTVTLSNTHTPSSLLEHDIIY